MRTLLLTLGSLTAGFVMLLVWSLTRIASNADDRWLDQYWGGDQ
jgi:hypothetical protein